MISFSIMPKYYRLGGTSEQEHISLKTDVSDQKWQGIAFSMLSGGG